MPVVLAIVAKRSKLHFPIPNTKIGEGNAIIKLNGSGGGEGGGRKSPPKWLLLFGYLAINLVSFFFLRKIRYLLFSFLLPIIIISLPFTGEPDSRCRQVFRSVVGSFFTIFKLLFF